GPPKFYSLAGEPDGIQALAEDANGALLIGWHGGLHRFVNGKPELYPLSGFARPFRAKRILRDGDGGLWIGTSNQGLMHVHKGSNDAFAQPDGLSGDAINRLFVDREGCIWVGTANGLDRFRDFAVATLTDSQGLSSAAGVGSVLADRDGSLWLATRRGLNRWNNGQVKTYRLGHDRRGG